jgi:uncharacterized delta-60 repeat protein
MVLVVAAASSTAYGVDGALDPTFGNGGRVVTGFDVPAASATSVALQSDGRIVTAGFLFDATANVDFALARYNPDGSLDSTFDLDGRTRTDFFGADDVANALVIQPNGKIVAVGNARNGLDLTFALARYNADGSLDATFGSDGKVTGGFFGTAYAVALQPDGKIVAAGNGYRPGGTTRSQEFTVARYNTDGTIDSTFGSAGIVQADFYGLNDSATALLVLPGGDLLAIGYAESNATVMDIALAKYHADGSPDGSFGIGGKTTTDFFGGADIALAAALQPDGKVVVAGGASAPGQPGNRLSIIRYRSDGFPDTLFGNEGIASVGLSGDGGSLAVAMQADGRIVAGGLALGADVYDFALARFSADGIPDSTFGSGGLVLTDFLGGSDTVRGIVIQPDGNIVAAGGANDATAGYFALARYLTEQASVRGGCGHTAGYWRKHSELWPVSSLLLGAQTYSRPDLLGLLTSPIKADASLLLARELIAAKLNIASGAGSAEMMADSASADGLLAVHPGRLPYHVPPSTPTGRAMIQNSARLAAENGRSSQCLK